jgi:hypothetical protein
MNGTAQELMGDSIAQKGRKEYFREENRREPHSISFLLLL